LDESTLDEEAAVNLLHSPLGGADPMSERRLRQALRQIAAKVGDGRASGELLVEALTEPSVLSMLDGWWVRPARTIADLMRVARETAARKVATAEDVLWQVWRASGLSDKWAAHSARGPDRGVPGPPARPTTPRGHARPVGRSRRGGAHPDCPRRQGTGVGPGRR